MGTMIGWLVGKQIFGRTIGEKGASLIAHLALVLALAAMIGGVVAWIRSDAVSDHQAKIERRAAPATDAAATERANDAIANAKKDEERHDAIHSVPDTPPGGPSHALACKRLHDLGRDPPSCR
jgi:predicted lipid-binding transport protein (Tim44 family)